MRIPAGALSGGRLQGDGAWNADSRAHAQVADPTARDATPAQNAHAAGPLGVGGSTSDSPDVRGHTGSVPPSGAGISAVVATEGHGYRSSDPTWKVFGYEVPREERQDWCKLNKELLDGQREEPRNIRLDANILRGWVTDAGQLKKQPRVVRFLVSSTFTVCSGTLKNPQMNPQNPQNPHEKERKSLVRHELGFRTTSTICARHTRFGRSFI